MTVAARDGCRDAVTIQGGTSVTQHPNLHLVDARCSACGATFALRSTAEKISVDVCSNCHPAYTGHARTLTAGGRIERFNRRRVLAAT
jgi:large subunit ribosomal protein L31